MKYDRIIMGIIIAIIVFIVFSTYSIISIIINPKGYCCPYFIKMLNSVIYYIYILSIAVLFVLILILINNIKKLKKNKEIMGKDNAIEILRERYARGEISKEEYDRMLEDLKKG